ncbi:hypothetical protein QQ045_017281 [Rhodiola kirilowii]
MVLLSVTPVSRASGPSPSPFPLISVAIREAAGSGRAARLTITAKKKACIDGVGEELNKIASLNLDSAPARRRVRSAFKDVQLQLDHCLFKMAPHGIRTNEWYELNSKSLEVFTKSWMPKHGVELKGALFFCHGYGDTCTFFFEGIARYIAASGYAVYAMDYPGFGLSDGLHGYIPSFDGLVDMVSENYSRIKARPELKGLPRFILGQSMGGAVTIKAHLKQPNAWDGVILVAPMCKIADDIVPSESVIKAMALLSKIMPQAKLFPTKDIDELAFRDLQKRKLAVYNVLCYNDKTRLGTAMECFKATNDIERQVARVKAPLLIVHGASDKITDPDVSKFLYENSSSADKTLNLYDQGFHCILEGEPDDRIFQVLDDIISWLDSRIDRDKS